MNKTVARAPKSKLHGHYLPTGLTNARLSGGGRGAQRHVTDTKVLSTTILKGTETCIDGSALRAPYLSFVLRTRSVAARVLRTRSHDLGRPTDGVQLVVDFGCGFDAAHAWRKRSPNQRANELALD